jgi:2-oxoglutarate ferredoxin oxidoreductase subunit alpha
MGYDYAKAEFKCPIGLRCEARDAVGDQIFLEGNSAAALGAVYGGATVCAWYPITPSSSVAEAFERHCKKFRREPETGDARFAIIQAEDELASIGMVIGAAWNGASFTATSGPGISLMQEFIGLAYFAEIPAVIIDVQRGGPSTGMPTRTQQSDVLSCAYASHGDTKHVLLFPEDPREAFELTALAFDYADRLQTPIFVMSDLDIGMNERLCKPLSWDDSKLIDRGKVMTYEMLEAGTAFGRYLDVDGDGIPYRTYPGTHPSRAPISPAAPPRTAWRNTARRARTTSRTWSACSRSSRPPRASCRRRCAMPTRSRHGSASMYYGSTSPAMEEAFELLQEDGIVVDGLRMRAFPFHEDVEKFVAAHDMVFLVEQNRDAQLRTLLMTECEMDPAKLTPVLHYDGTPITARFIAGAIATKLGAKNAQAQRSAAGN